MREKTGKRETDEREKKREEKARYIFKKREECKSTEKCDFPHVLTSLLYFSSHARAKEREERRDARRERERLKESRLDLFEAFLCCFCCVYFYR